MQNTRIMTPQTKITSFPKMGYIVALLIVLIVSVFITAKMTMITTTMEESVPHPNSVIAIIVDLRNLRAAAEIYRKDNLDKLDTVKPELRLLDSYLENSARFTKTRGEYIFNEANGSWWVGYNLSATDKYSLDRAGVCERLRMMAHGSIYGSMDIRIPYFKEDIVFMRVQ